jgi:hypothetical protein
MHEPLAESLSRFTPDSGGLDRDTLLFAAGQASARRSTKSWGVLVGVLSACQLLTLVLLWPESKLPTRIVVNGPTPVVDAPIIDPVVHAPDSSSLQALTRRAMESADGDLPGEVSTESPVIEPPPLRASSALIAIQ